jgi:Protein of unknown function (DUF4239)
MNDWLHNLPVVWLTVLIFCITYLVALGIFAVVTILTTGERARGFRAISPGVLPPLGILFGLFVAFTAVEVWNANDRAGAAIDREASALRTVLILAVCFPQQPQAHLHTLIRGHIEEATAREWPSMAHRTATLRIIPGHLAEALRFTLTLTPSSAGQRIAQNEMVVALESALDARRQRILISQSHVGLVKWLCILVQAICLLLAVALVHSDNQLAALIMLAIFSTGAAACVLLIASYDRPFIGQLAIGPEPLLQVMPEVEGGAR